MADLKAFQGRLNTEPEVRARFLEDPIGSLEAEGLVLPEDAKARLIEFVTGLTATQQPVLGSTLDDTGVFKIFMNIECEP